jgi:4-azaleucine resistance transporter AzlC
MNATSERTGAARDGWRGGVSVGIGLGLAVFALAISFGTSAIDAGWPAWLLVLMSALIFAAGAQFAVVVALAGGGGILAALLAGTLINLRFVPMAITAAASLRGGRLRRSLEAQAVVDGSWAAARRSDGSIDREKMIAASLVQWPAWILGTAVGAYFTPDAELAYSLGLDVIFPAFFLVFVLDAFREEKRHRSTIVVAGIIAAGMCWVVPPGLALLSAGVAAVLAVRDARRIR